MADSDKTLSESQEVITDNSAVIRRFQELEAMVKKLQKENAELKANVDPVASNLAGLSKNQLHSLSKTLTNMAKCKCTDSESDDEDPGEDPSVSDPRALPTCYTDMTP